MKFSSALFFASAASAAPLVARGLSDTDILQYALTLEHLENAFYHDALAKMSEAKFMAAGYSAQYYKNLQYIATDEKAHVQALTAALQKAGKHPVQPCEYHFPYTDVKSFIALSGVLEGVGTSAYLGGAPAIQSKAYLGVAGSILVTEAIHTSLQRFVQNLIAPANPYGTALGVNEVYTLAGAFIKKCPSTNAKLPLMAFPTLTASSNQHASPGSSYCFNAPKKLPYGKIYVTYLSGLAITSEPAYVKNGKIYTTIAPDAEGQTYAVLTNCKVTGALQDSQVIAGPAIVEVAPMPPSY